MIQATQVKSAEPKMTNHADQKESFRMNMFQATDQGKGSDAKAETVMNRNNMLNQTESSGTDE